MKKLLAAVFAAALLSCLFCFAEQAVPDSAEFGRVLLCDDFESCAVGADIITSGTTSPAFVNTSLISGFTGAAYRKENGCAYEIVNVDGNKKLKVSKSDPAWRWPQILLILNQELTEGEYTLGWTATYPSGSSGIYNVNTRYQMVKKDGSSVNADPGQSISGGSTVRLGTPMVIGGDSEYASLRFFILFATADNSTAGSYFYIDDVALYAKKDKIVYRLPNGRTFTDFVVSGETAELANVTRFADVLGKGETVLYYEKDGVHYAPRSEYAVPAGTASTVFDVVVGEKTYAVTYDLDAQNGTIAEQTVCDGDTVTLPDPGKDGFLYWNVGGVGQIASGGTFVFDSEKLSPYFDADGRLPAVAVYKSAPALVSPALPSLPSSGSVGMKALLRAAVALHAGVYGNAVPADDAALAAYAEENGVCESAPDLSASATLSDAVCVLANALPARFYPALQNGAFPGEATGEVRACADKLYRAGILDENAVLAAALDAQTLSDLVGKLCSRSMREASDKRTIYVFGDSLCAPNMNSWAEKFRGLLDDDIDLVNYSVGGYNTGSFLLAMSGLDSYKKMLQNVKPGDYVFVPLGTNDATLWLYTEHPELTDSAQRKTYASSVADYHTYAKDARAAGAVPVFIVPVSRNINYGVNELSLSYDARIVKCMEDANSTYGEHTPILNFKPVTDPLINEQMTADERAAFYQDSVHYTDSGAQLVGEIFRDIVLADDTAELTALRTHLSDGFDTSAAPFVPVSLMLACGMPDVDPVIPVTNEGLMSVTFTPVFVSYDADGRVCAVKVWDAVSVAAGETVGLDVTGRFDESRTNRLFFLDADLRPVREPELIVAEDNDFAIEIDELFR